MSLENVRIVITNQCLMQGEVLEVGKTITLSEHAAKQLIHAGKAIIEPVKTVEQKHAEIALEKALKTGEPIIEASAEAPIFDAAASSDDDVGDGTVDDKARATKYDNWTLKQLQEELQKKLIPYGSRDSKAQLLALLAEEQEEQS